MGSALTLESQGQTAAGFGTPAGVWEAIGVKKPTEKNLTPAEAKPLRSAKTPRPGPPRSGFLHAAPTPGLSSATGPAALGHTVLRHAPPAPQGPTHRRPISV